MAYHTRQGWHRRPVHLEIGHGLAEKMQACRVCSQRTATDLDVVDRVGETLKEKVSGCFLGV